MTFDSNLAWKQASAAVLANRDVLLALAGVFFLIPSLAFSLLFPQPESPPGIGQEALIALVTEYYASAAPFLIPMALVQAIGTLAMLTLFTDRSRPTVGEAIRRGVAGIAPYLVAQLLLGLGVGVGGGVALGLAGVTGQPLLVAAAVVAVVLGVILVAIRTSLVAPLVAVEHMRNPVAALRRSWDLTRSNGGRLGLFYLLVIVAFVVVVSLVLALAGIVLALALGPDAARIASSVLSAAFGAVMTIYMVAILAAAHRQFAGPSPEAIGRTFD